MALRGELGAAIVRAIGASTGATFILADERLAHGGDISRSMTLTGADGRRFFLKLNDVEHANMFAAEAEGLTELAHARVIRVPCVIALGQTGNTAWLVLEHLDLNGRGDARELGRRLASLHQTSSTHFGWHRDNTIGATHQPNPPESDWIAFYRDQRLGYQLALARRNGAGSRLLRNGEHLMADLAAFFPGYTPRPSLLHGDLWGGNYAYADGAPVLFDPAVYYGDREADLAMTELFGGFPAEFHAAYREAWPLDPGYATRRTLYNLYHVINHFNLFGGGYAARAEEMSALLLAQIR